MINALLQEREELVARGQPSYQSHSRINRYLHCPEQYRLHYVEQLRLRVPQASLVFGQVVHQALAKLFEKKGDPVKHFQDTWNALQRAKLAYNQRESWEKLRDSGEGLLRKFLAEELPKLGEVRAAEKVFELGITGLDLPFIGVVDLVAELRGKVTVVDFKTAGSAYDGHEAILSDQLTAYHLAEPQAEQLALCVLVKTKEPKIEWHLVERSAAQVTEYLAKVGYVAHEIALNRFYKRPGMWCAWCDFLPVCLGDTRRAEETLVKVP